MSFYTELTKQLDWYQWKMSFNTELTKQLDLSMEDVLLHWTYQTTEQYWTNNWTYQWKMSFNTENKQLDLSMEDVL